MKLVPKIKDFQSAIPQHQKGIELGPISDSGIASISNCSSFMVKRLQIYLRTMERDLMRPVPVVFLLLAWDGVGLIILNI